MTHYKLTHSNGRDFYTGTLDYTHIGSWVEAPDWNPDPSCGGGLHLVTAPLEAFRWGAKIPCRVFIVRPGRDRVSFDGKTKARRVRVLSEVTDLDGLLGFNYSEAVNPVHPFAVRRRRPGPTKAEIAVLERWASVWESVWESVRASVWASVGVSVGVSVRESVWESVWENAWENAWESVWASVWAYIGSLFPNITDWQGIDHEPGVYPFESAAWLWRRGLVPSFDGTRWRLHAGPDGRIVWEGESS